jgi:hypothetical protein
MEFAEWVVSGLDQLRLGQLPAGNGLYEAATAGLGGDPRLPGYMNSGDPAARAELVQLIAGAVAANPGFEQQLRNAAAVAQSGGFAGPAGGGASAFFKTTNGKLALVAAVVVVVGGGIGLGVGLSGGGGNLAGILKGTWTCKPPVGDEQDSPVSVTIGDGTWSAGSARGTWTQSGSTGTLNDPSDSGNNIKATNLPSGTGPFDIAVSPTGGESQLGMTVHIKGTLSATKLTVTVPGGDGVASFSCTK